MKMTPMTPVTFNMISLYSPNTCVRNTELEDIRHFHDKFQRVAERATAIPALGTSFSLTAAKQLQVAITAYIAGIEVEITKA